MHVPIPDKFTAAVQRRHVQLRRRGLAVASAEAATPYGQAALWFDALSGTVPLSGLLVARQLARLCGHDSQVTVPWRSLADAVGRRDEIGRTYAYTQRGVKALVEAGWLRVEVAGRGRGASTTFYLVPGGHGVSELAGTAA